MKALTVQQPWAWAVVHGGKDVENRTQAWSYRGPLAIHAGRRWSTRGGGLIPGVLDSGGLVPELLDEEQRRAYEAEFGADENPSGASGAIIGVVDLVDAHHYAGSGPDRIDCCESPWAEESYDENDGRHRLDIVHLVLERPRALAVPVPCRGALGLWTVPAGVDEQVLAQLEEAVR